MQDQNTISIVAIFKNEHRFIEQWIRYHLQVGVDHFYLYDNGGDHWELLAPFSDKITYLSWDDEKALAYKTVHRNQSRQLSAYTHCLDHYSNETEWLQLLDLDEFLIPNETGDVRKSVKVVNQKAGIIRVPRYNFGNSGHWKKAAQASISEFSRRERKPSHFKDLGRMAKLKKVKNPHMFRAKGKKVWITDLSIAHQYTRSLSEWMARAKVGGGQAGKGFRWFIGQRPWLAFATYFFLNIRSIVPIALVVLWNSLILFMELNSWLLVLNFPLIGWFLFAWLRGQNEVKDSRLKSFFRPEIQ